MTDCIDLMMAEHQNILRFTDAVEQACCRVLEGEAPDTAYFRDALRFGRAYADRHHHGKEEQLLFRTMQEQLGPIAENLIRHGMLVEHDLGRMHAACLEEALTRYEAQHDVRDKLAILTEAMGYASLLRRHIEREDGAVYLFARRSLSAEAMAALNADVARFEEDHARETEESLLLLDKLCKN